MQLAENTNYSTPLLFPINKHSFICSLTPSVRGGSVGGGGGGSAEDVYVNLGLAVSHT